VFGNYVTNKNSPFFGRVGARQLRAALKIPIFSGIVLASPRWMSALALRRISEIREEEVEVMRRVFPPFVGGRTGIGLLLIRIVAGAALIAHGMPKIGNPFHWMDKAGNAAPAFLQGLAALAEFGGGAALILGLLTPLAALGIACDMAYALFLVHLPKGDPFVANSGGSYEKALIYLATSIALMLTGPGRYSLDAQFFRSGASVIHKAWVRPTAA